MNTELQTAILNLGGDPADMPFWEGCLEGRFLLHRCNICGQHYWPASRCVEHGNQDMAWVDSSGRGQLYTYTVMHRVFSPAFKDKAPYVVGVIQLDEGPFFHSNVIDCDQETMAIGMHLCAVMQPHESGLSIPLFKPAL